MDNDTIKDLGLCPICQKGHIMKGSLGYSCNYFKNMNDKCTFNIYHSYWGKEITEEIARQLITTGKQIYFMTSIIKRSSFFCISDYRKWNRYSFFRK